MADPLRTRTRVDRLPCEGGFGQGVHVDVHIVVNPRPAFARRRTQDTPQVLEEAPAEANRRHQEQGFQPGAVKPLANELTRGDEHLDLAGLEPFRQRLALFDGQIAGEHLGRDAVAIFQHHPQVFTMGLAIRQDQADTFARLVGRGHILGDEQVARLVLRQFGEHAGIFAHRIEIGPEFGLPQDHLRGQDIPAFHQSLRGDFTVHVPEMPENQFG